MRVLGIVTARGGSKGIPRKNIVPFWQAAARLHGRAALAARRLTALCSPPMTRRSPRSGGSGAWKCPFSAPPNWPATIRRPFPCCKTWCGSLKPAATATTPSSRCSPPHRCAVRGYRRCHTLLEQTGADAVISFVEVGEKHPARMKFIDGDGRVIDPPLRNNLKASGARISSKCTCVKVPFTLRNVMS